VIQNCPRSARQFQIEGEYERLLKITPSPVLTSIQKKDIDIKALPEKLKHITLLAIIENKPEMINGEHINTVLLQVCQETFNCLRSTSFFWSGDFTSSIKILASVLDQRYSKGISGDGKTIDNRSVELIELLLNAKSQTEAQEIYKMMLAPDIACQTLREELASLQNDASAHGNGASEQPLRVNVCSFFSNNNQQNGTDSGCDVQGYTTNLEALDADTLCEFRH